MKILLLLIGLLLLPAVASGATFEAEVSLLRILDVGIVYLGLVDDDDAECAGVCIFPGLHFAFADDERNDQRYYIAGLDLFAKITGQGVWAR